MNLSLLFVVVTIRMLRKPYIILKAHPLPSLYYFLVVMVISVSSVLGQDQRISGKVEWGITYRTGDSGVEVLAAPVKGGVDVDGYPWVINNVELSGKPERINFELTSSEWEPVPDSIEVSFTGNKEEVQTSIGYARGRGVGKIMIPAFRNGRNGWERLTSYAGIVRTSGAAKRSSTRSFAASSVLAPGSGDWYKIAVLQDGIYKVDYDFLQNMGVDVTAITSSDVHVFGNGFGMLPEQNNQYRPDDLLQLAIDIEDGGDGAFDQGDYILFYGRGPSKWSYDGSDFAQLKNVYSDTSYYFINIDPSKAPKIIQTVSLPSQTPNHVVETFDDYAIINGDKFNLIKSGRQWYGDKFDVQTTFTYNFSFPNIRTDVPVKLSSRVLSNAVGQASSFDFIVNGSPSSASVNMDPLNPGNLYGPAADWEDLDFTFTPSAGSVSVTVNYNKLSPSAQGWLDFLKLQVRRNLTMSGSILFFRDASSVGTGSIAQYRISGATGITGVWDVTDPANIHRIDLPYGSAQLVFEDNQDSLRTYAAITGQGYATPIFDAQINNQDLHSLPQTDMIIVVHQPFRTEADRLADLHRSEGLSVEVVSPVQIYHEFSSGIPDPTAIRDFLRMFYQRSGGVPSAMPKYLLLFGDGSYDNRNITGAAGGNLLPTYQSGESLSPVSSFTSDDYYGLLDYNESMFYDDLLDIAVGRLPVSTVQQAKDAVNKIINYTERRAPDYSVNCCDGQDNSTMGDWRNKVVLIGDDEDGHAYVTGSEIISGMIETNTPAMNIRKIYFDAYVQESTPGGERYPDVEEEIRRSVQDGALVINYIGHGGEVGWGHERVLDIPTINSWTNQGRLPLFITATCEFSRFDDHGRVSAGELVFLNPNGGGIALLTTTRLVYSSPNQTLNENFYDVGFDRDGYQGQTIGDLMVYTKNQTANEINGNNFRNFTLLGDPAVRLALPSYDVRTDSLNGVEISGAVDTLKALSEVTISGHVSDPVTGTLMSGFNGTIVPVVYDKAQSISTLQNDPSSSPRTFDSYRNVLYKGKATVENGLFSFTFKVPKDISLQHGNGRISYYVHSDTTDGFGYNESIVVGGVDTSASEDNDGPQIEVFLNDKNFVDGGITDETPVLLAELFDQNGINTVGNGIGHDITVVLDQETDNSIILNDYYESDVDTYQSGVVKYPFSELSEGNHTLTFKAWDVYNNSSERTIDFIVASDASLVLDHVLNYPNPFTTNTTFMFEHNQSCSGFDVMIQVFTVSGKLVKTIDRYVATQGYRVEGIEWDGKDDFGDQLARGVYIYKITVEAEQNIRADHIERLVILK